MQRGLTLLELLVTIVITGIVGVLLITSICGCDATYHSRITACANNLSQLWKMQHIYMSKYGGSERLMYPGTGKDFWLHLASTNPPLIESSVIDIYYCPMQDYDADGTHYLGPSTDVNTLPDRAPVGCDEKEHYGDGGGNVLVKAGDVFLCPYTIFKDLRAKCSE